MNKGMEALLKTINLLDGAESSYLKFAFRTSKVTLFSKVCTSLF